MTKTILKTLTLATVASLAMSGYALAHHPSEGVNPNFETVDANISDMHNTIIDARLEDGDLMGMTARSAGAEPSTTAAMGDAVEQTSSNMGAIGSAAPATNFTGISSRSMAQGANGAGRR